MSTSTCTWTEDFDGLWASDCQHVFEFFAGGPEDNGFRFCCWCGRHLVEIPHFPDADEVSRQLLALALKSGAPRGES